MFQSQWYRINWLDWVTRRDRLDGLRVGVAYAGSFAAVRTPA